MLLDYRIAGLRVRMDTFGRTARLALPYRIQAEGEADVCICSQRERLLRLDPELTEDSAEYIATGRDFHTKLLPHDGMVLHASAVLADGRVYLFSADSGVGKSTHTRLWQQLLGPEHAVIINDDKPALRRLNGVWHAFGTPWCGKDGLNRNLSAPLGGLCFLERGGENRIEPYAGDDLLFRFLRQTRITTECTHVNRMLSLIDALAAQIPIWRLQCTPTPEAAQLAYRHMAGIGVDA